MLKSLWQGRVDPLQAFVDKGSGRGVPMLIIGGLDRIFARSIGDADLGFCQPISPISGSRVKLDAIAKGQDEFCARAIDREFRSELGVSVAAQLPCRKSREIVPISVLVSRLAEPSRGSIATSYSPSSSMRIASRLSSEMNCRTLSEESI